MKLVLHNYWRSSASHRVRIALGLKELAYEYVAINLLHGDQEAGAYRAKNPLGRVPTLEVTEDDGSVHVLTQSLPIIEFLDERFADRPVLPRDPYLRAHARALAEIVNSAIQPFQNLATTKQLKALGVDDQSWARGWIEQGLAAFARLAGDRAGTFCVGDTPTVADAFLVPQLAAARRFAVDLTGHVLLLGIEERCLALPAFANAAPDQQPDAVKKS